MANWTQKQLLVAIGGGAVTICLCAAGGVYYTYGLIEEVEAQVAQKKEAVAAADAKIAKIPVLEKDVIILRENLDEYVKVLPDTNELSAFVRGLQAFDRQSGVMSTGLVPRTKSNTKGVDRFTPIEYSYEMTGTLWQALKFMNLVENFERFISIKDFSITSGAKQRGDSREGGDVVHTIKMTLQTYQYNGKPSGKEAVIPDYAAQKEALREEIYKRMQAIRIDRYEHRGQGGRRDVLVDPRERGGDLRIEGPTQAEQRAVLERYIGEVTKLREMMQRIKKADLTLFEQYSLEKGLKEGVEKLQGEMEGDASRVSYAPYRLRWAKEVIAPVDELRQQMDARQMQTTKDDPFLRKKDIEQLIADMAADCNTGQLEQAKSRYESVAARLNVPPDDPRHALVIDAKSWHVKATTALDFKSLDLRVQGVVVNRGGRSGVLLNGETYEEGDYVADDLLIKMVEEEQIWFVFRGLTLVRTM